MCRIVCPLLFGAANANNNSISNEWISHTNSLCMCFTNKVDFHCILFVAPVCSRSQSAAVHVRLKRKILHESIYFNFVVEKRNSSRF